MKKTLVLLAALLVAGATASAAAQNGKEAGTQGESFGLPIYPGSTARPEFARAVEVYYQPGLTENQRLIAGVFETPDAFQEVVDFYTPRMPEGKRGWRTKKRVLEHQALTLKYYRAELLARQGDGKQVPAVLAPFMGDPELSQEEFAKELQDFIAKNEEAVIQIAEGSRRVQGDPANSLARITVERPYIDLERMELVDRTRILLVKIGEN